MITLDFRIHGIAELTIADTSGYKFFEGEIQLLATRHAWEALSDLLFQNTNIVECKLPR